MKFGMTTYVQKSPMSTYSTKELYISGKEPFIFRKRVLYLNMSIYSTKRAWYIPQKGRIHSAKDNTAWYLRGAGCGGRVEVVTTLFSASLVWHKWLFHRLRTECVMSHMWVSHVTHMSESCHTCEWGMSNMWMSHVTHMNESCHACQCVVSHMWMSHVTHVNEACHTCEWVMSHLWMSHITPVNEWRHTYEWGMSHIWMCHVTHMNESCHTC